MKVRYHALKEGQVGPVVGECGAPALPRATFQRPFPPLTPRPTHAPTAPAASFVQGPPPEASITGEGEGADTFQRLSFQYLRGGGSGEGGSERKSSAAASRRMLVAASEEARYEAKNYGGDAQKGVYK